MARVQNSTSAAPAQRALEHCKYLSLQIGPRPACEVGERDAARYARDAMRAAGIHNAREELLQSGRRTYRPFTLALLAGLSANLLVPNAAKAGRVRRFAASFLAVSGALGFAREANLQANWMRRMLGQGDSQNVVGIVPASGEMRRRVVICSHLDSHRTPIFYSHPRWLKLFSRLIALAFGSLCIGAALHAASTCRDAERADRGAKLKKIAALIQSLAIALTLQAETTPHTHGANDNASGRRNHARVGRARRTNSSAKRRSVVCRHRLRGSRRLRHRGVAAAPSGRFARRLFSQFRYVRHRFARHINARRLINQTRRRPAFARVGASSLGRKPRFARRHTFKRRLHTTRRSSHKTAARP